MTKQTNIKKKRWDTRPPYLPPGKPVCRSRATVRKGCETMTGSKLEKEYIKAVYFHPAI